MAEVAYQRYIQHDNTMKKIRSNAIVPIAILTLAFGIWVGWKAPIMIGQSIPKANGIVFANAKPIADFELVDHHGVAFDLNRLLGYWSLIYFGYTYCPDLCPMALSQLGQMSKEFQIKRGASLQYIFVSVDPDRDTVNKLESYVKFFSPDMIGLTGSIEQLEKLASPLAVRFRLQSRRDTNYLVDHSNTILLINPTGEFQAIFSAPHTAVRLAADMRAINEWHLDLN